jgi:hypothetical protein
MSDMFLSHHHKKIREIGLGLFLYETWNYIFDFIFYPIAIAYWGIVNGGAIAVSLSFITNSIVFVIYEYLQIDWLGAHALRKLDQEENKSNIAKLMTWMGSHKKTWWEKLLSPVVFIALTLPIDPLIVAVHHRRQHFKGITMHDWLLLWGATLAANAWWLLKVGVIIEAAKFVWNWQMIF